MSAIQQMMLAGDSGPVIGQVAYTVPGIYSWVCPAGVTSVSIVCIGGGAAGGVSGATNKGEQGGGGGGLGYSVNYAVVPGDTYTVVVGSGGVAGSSVASDSYFVSTSVCAGFAGNGAQGGSFSGNGGAAGGQGGASPVNGYGGSGGGGAGGYGRESLGGSGGYATTSPVATEAIAGEYGGGGGGGAAVTTTATAGANGGGVGIFGMGATGAAGSNGNPPTPGGDGSGGNYGYGGGGSGRVGVGEPAKNGGSGAVRIIWPGNLRYFPSTRTADE